MLPTLYTDRLILEPLSLKHLSQDYVNWLNDETVNKYLETRGGYSLEKLEVFLKEQEAKKIAFWAILTKDTETHIGNIKIDPIDAKKRSGEYGILIGDKNVWGKGYGKEATKRVIDFCFEDMDLKEITLGVIKENKAAATMYSKMGFNVVSEVENYGEYGGGMCGLQRMTLRR